MAASTFLRILLLTLPALACSSQEPEYVLEGTVTRVVDGDTIDVQLDSGPIRVRMQGIDAPERGQPLDDEAVDTLQKLIGDGAVELLPAGQVSYTRMVARVYVGEADINAEMVRRGFAMAERRFLREFDDGDDYCVFEHAARSDQLGLWRLPPDQRIAPWEWRQRNRRETPFTDYRTETVASCIAAIGKPFSELRQRDAPTPEGSALPSAPRTEQPAAGSWSCSTAKTCRQMASCEEARFHLSQCGAPIDGDQDGVPCEAICR